MDYIEIEKGRWLSAEQMTNIYNNFQYIAEFLTDNYGIEGIDIIDNSVNYSISPAEILNKMNSVESNIQNIHNAVYWYDEFFKLFKWKKRTANKRQEVERWIDWLNDMYLIITNQKTKYAPLADIDSEYITDKDGNQIYVLIGYAELCDENGNLIKDINNKQITVVR